MDIYNGWDETGNDSVKTYDETGRESKWVPWWSDFKVPSDHTVNGKQMDLEFQMTFQRPGGVGHDVWMSWERRLDGKMMTMSVFFDRRVANEDNPFFDEFDL